MNELAVSGSLKITNMDELARLSEMFLKSGFFTDAKSAAQCGVKILAGMEHGFEPFASMTGIHIINGKPTLGANLIAAAVKRNEKYDYRVKELTDKVCRITFFEHGEEIGESEFTIDDAKKAQTKNVDKYPRNMLFARAISNGVRWHCPDVFSTAVYTPEEMGAEVDESGNVIDIPVVEEVDYAKVRAVQDEMEESFLSKAEAAELHKNLAIKFPNLDHDELSKLVVHALGRGVDSFTDIERDEIERLMETANNVAKLRPWATWRTKDDAIAWAAQSGVPLKAGEHINIYDGLTVVVEGKELYKAYFEDITNLKKTKVASPA